MITHAGIRGIVSLYTRMAGERFSKRERKISAIYLLAAYEYVFARDCRDPDSLLGDRALRDEGATEALSR